MGLAVVTGGSSGIGADALARRIEGERELDIVVNCAGQGGYGPFAELDSNQPRRASRYQAAQA